MILQNPLNLRNSSTLFSAAARVEDSAYEKFFECKEELGRLVHLCEKGLHHLRHDRHRFKLFKIKQLERLRSLCIDTTTSSSPWRSYPLPFNYSRVWKLVLDLRRKVEKAYSDAVSDLVIFSLSSAERGKIYLDFGSHGIPAPDDLRVDHPLLQIVLFAHRKFLDGSFGCLKSMAPKIIARAMVTPASSASPTEYITDCVSAKRGLGSPSAVRNPPCRSKKPLLPALFNIFKSKKTSSTVCVIPQSGDNVKSGSYDSSMTVAKGNRGISKSILEVGKAGHNLFGPDDTYYQQHDAFTGGSHIVRLQVPMPTAAGFVKCGNTDEKSMLTKLISPQEQFILNSSGDGGSGNPYSDSALRITPFAKTISTPMVPELIEIGRQHLRQIDLASEVNCLESVQMMNGSQGINSDGPMHCVFILDSGSPEHCTGDISQLSDYCTEVRPDRYLRGAGGTLMQVHGTGSIRNENFQVEGVLHVPGLNNQPNINKTIFSVAKLNELGYSILFNSDGTCFVIDNSKWTWNLKHEIIGKARKDYGHFMLDYLRIPLNRAPMPMLEGPGLLKSLRNASLTVWRSITGHLSQRTICAQRPPV